MSDFTYIPSPGSEVNDRFATLEAVFGDGYKAIAPDGINAVKESRRLMFENIKRTDGEAIRTFMRGKQGQSFTWTPPGGSEKRWILIGEVSMRETGPLTVNVSLTLEEWFGA